MIIAVTGGIGAGKSLASRLLGKLLGIEVLDADFICRNLLQPQMPGWQRIREKWGGRFFDSAGNINRVALRKALFADLTIRQDVEGLLHPLVYQEITRLSRVKRSQGEGMVVEVPLLFEVGWQDIFDWIVVVYADQKCCLQRIVKRDRVTLEEGEMAINSQFPLAEKALLADSVIENSGPLALTIFQIYHLSRLLTAP